MLIGSDVSTIVAVHRRSEAHTLFSVDGAEAVVAHFVHETVEQRLRALLVDAELAGRSVVVVFLDVLAFLRAAADTHHPQELVDVCGEEK